MNHDNIRRMVLSAIMTAVAITLHFVEGLFPIPVAIPGIKLGLPNIVSLVALYLIGPVDAYAILILRVFMTSFLYSGFSSLIFSLAGGILSVTAMFVIWKLREKGFSIISASVTGGVFHNVGQILAAAAVLRTFSVFYYLPVLIVSGITTGVVTGIVSASILPRLNKIYRIK
ncbi:MAG TPA: Gx transporter family protein [Thermoclostridium sp.]